MYTVHAYTGTYHYNKIYSYESLSLSLSPKLLRYKTMQTAVRSTFITQVKYDGR